MSNAAATPTVGQIYKVALAANWCSYGGRPTVSTGVQLWQLRRVNPQAVALFEAAHNRKLAAGWSLR